MQKFLLLFFLLSLGISANTPNMFKAVGDPIYNQITAVEKMLKISYFKQDKLLFKEFTTKAKAHQRLGFIYDKKRQKKTLSKEEQKAYLDTLRKLAKQLNQIHFIVHEALPAIIKKGDTKSFYQLKNSGLDIIHNNTRNVQMITKHDQSLKRQNERVKIEQDKREKERIAAYHKMLRSSKNLEGTWKGRSNEGSELLAVFKADKLTLSYITTGKTNVFLGTYSIAKELHFTIRRRELTKSKNTHTRDINLKRSYAIKKITDSELVLAYKDEIITLKRVKI
ncbi:hypothetical protein ACFLR3_00155 [Campylobacterota bacterium]